MKISLTLEITRHRPYKGPYKEVEWQTLSPEERTLINTSHIKSPKKSSDKTS